MASLKVACVVALMCMVVVTAPMAEAAISCGAVTGYLGPCISYLKGGPGPSLQCCGGVKKLNAAAQTTPARKAACNCLKDAAGSTPGLNANNAATLSAKCGLSLPYKFGPNTDCTSIRL